MAQGIHTRKRIAIITALESEAEVIRSVIGKPFYTDLGMQVVFGTFADVEIFLVVGGMGMNNAAAATQYAIIRSDPDAIIFTGIAGSLNPQLLNNDVVIGKKLTMANADMSIIAESAPYKEYFSSDPMLVAMGEYVCCNLGGALVNSLESSVDSLLPNSHTFGIENIVNTIAECSITQKYYDSSNCNNCNDTCVEYSDMSEQMDIDTGFNTKMKNINFSDVMGEMLSSAIQHGNRIPKLSHYAVGNIISSNQFTARTRELLDLACSRRIDAEEMEGVATAQIAAKADVPYVVIRTISNLCGEPYDMLCNREKDIRDSASLAGFIGLSVAILYAYYHSELSVAPAGSTLDQPIAHSAK